MSSLSLNEIKRQSYQMRVNWPQGKCVGWKGRWCELLISVNVNLVDVSSKS